MAVIAVSGTVTHRYHAERGLLRLAVELEGDDRSSVVDDSVAVHNRVTERATTLRRQGAATWWTARSVSVGVVSEPSAADGTRASSVRYRTRSTIEVRFQDFTALADWVGELAHVEGVTIEGVEWSLGHARRAEVEQDARLAAVADAVARASDYADALGLGAPELQAVYEPGLRPGEGGAGGVPFMASRSLIVAVTSMSSGCRSNTTEPESSRVEPAISEREAMKGTPPAPPSPGRSPGS
jgi:uncharacterized protein YggE